MLNPCTLEMLSKQHPYSHKIIMDFRIVTGNSNKKNAISATINDEEDVTRNWECVTESKDNIAGSIFPSHISTTTHCIHVHTRLVPISKILTIMQAGEQ